jgi:Holliday junction resolvase RusA-like endonuclease
MDRTVIEFFVPGEPRGKGRHRTRIVKTRAGAQFVHSYTPQETANYENLVKLSANRVMVGRKPLIGPVAVDLVATFVPPTSWSAKKIGRAMQGFEVPTRFDVDNIAKSIFDGANGVIWHDDKQIVDARIVKRFGDLPGVSVRVQSLVQQDLICEAIAC